MEKDRWLHSPSSNYKLKKKIHWELKIKTDVFKRFFQNVFPDEFVGCFMNIMYICIPRDYRSAITGIVVALAMPEPLMTV